MADPPTALRARCLCLDIETARQDRLVLREIGAFRPDLDARLKLSGNAPDLSARLDALTQDAAFVLGHNVIAFDQPALAVLHPALALHRLPLIDTLELSPIAFPQNPYHRLVKDYKLCTTTRNDPVQDAELAYALFLDQRAALQARVAEHPDNAHLRRQLFRVYQADINTVDAFCAALLNSQPMGFYAPAQIVRDARDHGGEFAAGSYQQADRRPVRPLDRTLPRRRDRGLSRRPHHLRRDLPRADRSGGARRGRHNGLHPLGAAARLAAHALGGRHPGPARPASGTPGDGVGLPTALGHRLVRGRFSNRSGDGSPTALPFR